MAHDPDPGDVEVVALVDDADPGPRPPTGPPRAGGWRRYAVAALVVAVAAAGWVVTRPEPEPEPATEETLPRPGGPTTAVDAADVPLPPILAAPEDDGFSVRAAHVPRALPTTNASRIVALHAPIEDVDPWPDAVTTLATSIGTGPGDALGGLVVDLGGPPAVLVTAGATRSLRWRSEGRQLSVAATTLAADELLALGRAAVEGGWTGDGPLPGHRIIHAGPPSDFFPTLLFVPPSEPGDARVGYRHDDGLDFVIAAGAGTPGRWRAAYHLARQVDRVELAGRPATVARFAGPTPAQIMWLTDDDVLITVETRADPARLVPTLASGLTTTTAEAFAALVARHPAEVGTPFLELTGPVPPPDLAEPLVRVTAEVDDLDHQAVLALDDAGRPQLRVDAGGASSAGTGAIELVDRTSTFLARTPGPRRPGRATQLIAGVVADEVAGLAVTTRDEGAPVPVLAQVSAPVPGGAVLVLVMIELGDPNVSLEVTGTTAGGSLRYWL